MKTNRTLIGLFNALGTLIHKGDLKNKLVTFDNIKVIEGDVLRLTKTKENIEVLLSDYNKKISEVYSKFGDVIGDGRIALPGKFNSDGSENKKYEEYKKELSAIMENADNISLVANYEKQIKEYEALLEKEVTKKYKFKEIAEENFPKDANGDEVMMCMEFEILKAKNS